MKKRALFIVDAQNDLSHVPFGDKVVPIINSLKNKFDVVIASIGKDLSFHSNLDMSGINVFINTDDKSGFSGNIEKFLKSSRIDEIYVVGPAGDTIVKETAKDCSVFFKTFFIVDATRFTGSINPTVEELVKEDIMVINSGDIDIFLSDEKYHKRHGVKEDNPFEKLYTLK